MIKKRKKSFFTKYYHICERLAMYIKVPGYKHTRTYSELRIIMKLQSKRNLNLNEEFKRMILSVNVGN